MLSGVWRCGKGIAGTDVAPDGTLTTPYTGTLGDETILLLEGEVDVMETDSGKKHSFRAGDAIGLTSGMHVTWVSKGPFCKKLWVITRDHVPNEKGFVFQCVAFYCITFRLATYPLIYSDFA